MAELTAMCGHFRSRDKDGVTPFDQP